MSSFSSGASVPSRAPSGTAGKVDANGNRDDPTESVGLVCREETIACRQCTLTKNIRELMALAEAVWKANISQILSRSFRGIATACSCNTRSCGSLCAWIEQHRLRRVRLTSAGCKTAFLQCLMNVLDMPTGVRTLPA